MCPDPASEGWLARICLRLAIVSSGVVPSGARFRPSRSHGRVRAPARIRAPLSSSVENRSAGQTITNEVSHMFEVTRFDYPNIFVTRHRTGETYKFSFESDGRLTHPDAHSGQGAARQVAVEWVARRIRSKELEFA